MAFLDLAWKRKSIRSFKPDGVPAEKIAKLLDAARSAPSAGNCQPWFFYVIGGASLKERIVKESRASGFIADAPVAIVVCADIARSSARYHERGAELYCVQDTAAAVQNLLLAAAEEGLAACWCGAFDEGAVSEILGLEKNMRPVAIIPIGYAVTDPPKTSRRPVEEICEFIGFDENPDIQSEPRRPKIEHQDMSGALFNDLNLENSEFVDINMKGCSFWALNLANSKISECDLSGMRIENRKTDGLTINGKPVTE